MVPFIDITLILLIIFMVMSPMLVQMQMTLDLPKSKAINTQAEDDVIRIEVTRDGTITVMNKKLTLKNLERELILRLGKANKKTGSGSFWSNFPIPRDTSNTILSVLHSDNSRLYVRLTDRSPSIPHPRNICHVE